MSNEHQNNDWKFMVGFFLGGLIGALIIFFLGTKEGKKVKEQLEDRGRELIKKGEEIKEQVLEKVEEKKEELTDSTKENVDEMLAKIEEIQKQGQAVTANLRRRFKNTPKKS